MDTQRNRDSRKKRPQPEQIHLKDYLAIIKKRKWVVILFSCLLIGLVTTYSFIATPMYQATATIVIDRQMYPTTRAEEALNIDIREIDFYQTQYSLLQSRSLALKVVKDLELWKEFEAAQPPRATGAAPETKSGNTSVAKPARKTSPKEQGNPPFSDWSDAVDWYLAYLKIEPVRGSRLVNISFMSRSPETAARVANAHALAFIAKSTETKLASSQQKLGWLKSHPRGKANTTAENAPGTSSPENENIFSLPEVAQDSVVLNLRNQLILLKAKGLELATNYGPKHPKVIDLNSRITQLEQEISQEVQRLSRTVSSSIENSNIAIVDEAEVPLAPAKPKRVLNILMAMMMSMFMGPFLAFFVEYMDRTVKTPEDVERRLGMAMLGAIPVYRSAKEGVNGLLSWDDFGPDKKRTYYYAGHMAVRLIPGLLSIRKQQEGRVLFVESATSGEGKTTILANSAISLARRGLRVLVIDADVFNPGLHIKFGLGNERGLISLMRGMLSQEIARGDLKTYSIDDLFFLIALKSLSCSLSVTNDSQTMTALFENGRLCHLQSTKSASDNRVGTALVRGGLVSAAQLEEALGWQQRTGQPLGYILINAGFITLEKLRGPLKLQMEEHLQRLFSWKQGTFLLEPGTDAEICRNERIWHGEDYTPMVHRYGLAAGNRFIEQELFSRILQAAEPNVWLLPAGSAETEPNIGPEAQMLFSKFLQVLKRHFDVIFVDAPPVLDMPDSAALSRQGDGVVFVVKAGKLSDKTITTATARLQESGANVLGVVLNQARLEKEQY